MLCMFDVSMTAPLADFSQSVSEQQIQYSINITLFSAPIVYIFNYLRANIGILNCVLV